MIKLLCRVGEFYLISENNQPSSIIHHTSASIEGVFYNKPQRRWWRRGLKYFIFVEG